MKMEKNKIERVVVSKKMFVWRKNFEKVRNRCVELCWINWVSIYYDGVMVEVVGECEDVDLSLCVIEGLLKGGYS